MKLLVIIGNGFDLGHLLPTSFSQFIRSNDSFQEKYEIFKGENWNNIESNYKELLLQIVSNREYVDIGDILEQIISDYGYNEYGGINYVHSSSDTFSAEINQIRELVKLLTEFEQDFSSYLKETCCRDKLHTLTPRTKIADILNSASYIINFNYTNVVEEVYKITRVAHIHGTIGEDNIAIGTNAIEELKRSMVDVRYPTEFPCKDKYDFQERMKYYVEGDDGQLYENQELRDLFDAIENSVALNESELFTAIDVKNKDMLFSRERIKRFLETELFDKVIVLGHSIGDADMSVFEKINKNAKLVCYFYEQTSDDDMNRMRGNLDYLLLDYELIPNGDLYKCL